MRKSAYKNLMKKGIKKWEQEKKIEWKKNANFWVKIIREKLDPFRLVVTNKVILESLKGKKSLKILDAGCGEGYFSRLLAKKGYKVFGIDFCPALIKAAKDLERKKPLNIKYSIGDFRKTNFPSSFFDVIMSHQSISEIKNPKKAFGEFSRILKKRGKLICLFLHPCFDFNPQKIKNTPLSLMYFQKIEIKKRPYLVSGIRSPAPYFYLHLSLSDWLKIIKNAGFSISQVKEPHPSLRLLKKSRWWRKNFDRPRFILIEAEKT